MNDQGKICGRAIADGMIKIYEFGKDKKVAVKYFTSKGQSKEMDFFYRVNKADLKAWDIKEEDLKDIVDQFLDMGSIEAIKDYFGILPNQGKKDVGLVFRSRTNPQVACHVVMTDLTSGSTYAYNYGSDHSSVNDYGQDAYLYFYYDIHHEATPGQGDEELLGDMHKLMYGGMTMPADFKGRA